MVRLGGRAMVAAAGEIAGRRGKVVRVEGRLLLVPRFRLQRKTTLLRPGSRLCLKSHLRVASTSIVFTLHQAYTRVYTMSVCLINARRSAYVYQAQKQFN